MTTSPIGVALVKEFESLHDGDLTQIGLQPKMCPAGIWTEGYGHAMIIGNKFLEGASKKDLAYKLATVKTEIEADKLLKQDLSKFESIVSKRIKVPLNQNQFDALVSHTFNTGGSNTLFKLINEKAGIDTIKNWWLTRYIQADGKTLKGLVRRRNAEFNLYISKL